MKAKMLKIVLVLAVAGLMAPAKASSAELKVVTTTTDLKAIADAVGGARVSVRSIGTGQEDPHFIQAKPSYMMAARRADLWIRIGLELEIGYEELLIDGSRNSKIRLGTDGHLDASAGVIRREVPTQKVDRSMGDIHPLGNPHYWLDPWNGRVMAGTIRDRLKKIDPGGAADYDANCRAFERRIDEAMFGKALVEKLGGEALWGLELTGKLESTLKAKDIADQLGGWKARMAPLRGTKVVTYHRSWCYFADRFGLTIVGELEPKPGIPPSPGHLAEVIEAANSHKARLMLIETFYEKNGPAFVASKTGMKVLDVPNSVGGDPEAKDYLSLIDSLVRKVSLACQGSP